MPHGTAVLEDRPNKREVDSQLCRTWYAAAFQGKRRVTVSMSERKEYELAQLGSARMLSYNVTNTSQVHEHNQIS